MDKEKKLVLVNQTENKYFPTVTNSFIIKPFYKNNSYTSRFIRKIVLKLNFKLFEKKIFEHWMNDISKCEIVVVFDIGNAKEILRFIRTMYPKKRIIFWYWNIVARSVDIKTIKDLDIEIWSFDKNDCHRYGLKNNTQFYFVKNASSLPNDYKKEFNDIIFVGTNKNRDHILESLLSIFESQGLSFFYYLVTSIKEKKKKSIKWYYLKSIKYTNLTELIRNCKAVLDIVVLDQVGLSLRPLEALYFKKKLITNCKSIKSEKLYNPNNVFILGEDNINKLKDFVNSPYDEKDFMILYKFYSESEWIKRFN
jgi:hypothetical protein